MRFQLHLSCHTEVFHRGQRPSATTIMIVCERPDGSAIRPWCWRLAGADLREPCAATFFVLDRRPGTLPLAPRGKKGGPSVCIPPRFLLCSTELACLAMPFSCPSRSAGLVPVFAMSLPCHAVSMLRSSYSFLSWFPCCCLGPGLSLSASLSVVALARAPPGCFARVATDEMIQFESASGSS